MTPLTKAQRTLAEAYLSHAEGIAHRYRRRAFGHLDAEELRSAAFLGLVLAAQRYTVGHDTPFLHFATCRIHGSIKDAIREHMLANGYRRARTALDQRMTAVAMRTEWPEYRTADGDAVPWDPPTPTPDYVTPLALDEALASVPSIYQRAVLAGVWDGYTHKEIAGRYKVSPGAIAQAQRNGIAAARRTLGYA